MWAGLGRADVQWEAMKQHSEGPYHLTLKSNGCLILISALSPEHLVVASKHSLGTTTEAVEADPAAPAQQKITQTKGKGKEVPTHPDAQDTEKQDRQHAEVGREWVRRTLQASGKTEADLAKRLWDENLTAVLEVSWQ